MKQKVVSIIIPTYNHCAIISETLSSVWKQRYRPLEVLVVDDGSTDETQRIATNWIQTHAEKPNFKARDMRQEHKGAPVARNLGAREATGACLMFLDSDDLLLEDTLHQLMAVLDEHPAGVGACCWAYFEEKAANWEEKEGKPLGSEQADFLEKWLRGWYIPPCAVLWKRAAYENLHGWDESLTANQDGDLMLRYFLAGGRMAFASQAKSLYRKQRNGVSLSEQSNRATIESREKVLDKVYDELQQTEGLESYRPALAEAFYMLSCEAYFRKLRIYGDRLQRRMKAIYPSFKTNNHVHRLLEKMMGSYYKEQLHRWVNRVLPGRSI